VTTAVSRRRDLVVNGLVARRAATFRVIDLSLTCTCHVIHTLLHGFNPDCGVTKFISADVRRSPHLVLRSTVGESCGSSCPTFSGQMVCRGRRAR